MEAIAKKVLSYAACWANKRDTTKFIHPRLILPVVCNGAVTIHALALLLSRGNCKCFNCGDHYGKRDNSKEKDMRGKKESERSTLLRVTVLAVIS